MIKSIVLSVVFILVSTTAFSQEVEINQLIDNWHQAAATADENVFFGSMTDDGIYIGTDKTERWTSLELKEWSKKYFERDKAWAFKPYDRDLHIGKKGKYAWFSELLDTWMGVCRGSGMLEKTKNGWKIVQYHLSVTIDNDLIKDFIQLVENAPEKEND